MKLTGEPASADPTSRQFRDRRMLNALESGDMKTALGLATTETQRTEIVLGLLVTDATNRLATAILRPRVLRQLLRVYNPDRLELRFRFCVGDGGTMPEAVLARIPIRTADTQLAAEFLTVVYAAIDAIDRLALHRLAGEIAGAARSDPSTDRWAAVLLSGILGRLAMFSDAAVFMLDYPPSSGAITFTALTFRDYANGEHPGRGATAAEAGPTRTPESMSDANQ